MKVKATQTGVYQNRAYQPGEVFDVKEEFFADASNNRYGWMVKVEAPIPPLKTAISAPTPVVKPVEQKGVPKP